MPVKKYWKKVEFSPSKSNYELYIESQVHVKAFCKHVIMVCLLKITKNEKYLKLQGLEKVKKFSIRSLHRSRKASKALSK